MTGMSSLFFYLMLLFTIVNVNGCGGKSAPTTFFMLSPASDVSHVEKNVDQIAVLVGPLAIAKYLDRDHIVTVLPGNQMAIDDLNQWAEPLADNIKRVLIEDLSTLLNTSKIYDESFQVPEVFDFQIMVEINRFHADTNGIAVLVAFWSLHDKDGATLTRKKAVLQTEAGGASLSGHVAVLNQMMADFSNEIAQAVISLSPGP